MKMYRKVNRMSIFFVFVLLSCLMLACGSDPDEWRRATPTGGGSTGEGNSTLTVEQTPITATPANITIQGSHTATATKVTVEEEPSATPTPFTLEETSTSTPLASSSPTPFATAIPHVAQITSGFLDAAEREACKILTKEQTEAVETAESGNQEGQFHTVQSEDRLSTISAQYYDGVSTHFNAIQHYHNLLAAQDANLKPINNINVIGAGMQIYIPTFEEIRRFNAGSDSSALQAVTYNHRTPPIQIKGSSTVFELTERLATCFVAHGEQEGFDGGFKIESTGTFDGIHALCHDEAQLLNASHYLLPDDFSAAECDPELSWLELQVGLDAVTIVINAENAAITEGEPITLPELQAILSTAETWQDVRATWPNEPITRFFPGEGSGTFRFVAEKLFTERDGETLKSALNIATELNGQPLDRENDDQLAAGVQNNPYAVSFFGFAFYEKNQNDLNMLPVLDKTPNRDIPEEVELAERYPLFRPLYVYTTDSELENDPALANFIKYYLQYTNDYISDVGFFPMSEEERQRSIDSYCTIRPSDC